MVSRKQLRNFRSFNIYITISFMKLYLEEVIELILHLFARSIKIKKHI